MKNLFTFIKEKTQSLLKPIAGTLTLIQTLLSVQLSASVAKILPEAIKVVAELAQNTEMSGKEKRKEAFKQLSEIVKTEGLAIGSSVVNLTIELAVAKLVSLKSEEK
jgi:hypothetical protein